MRRGAPGSRWAARCGPVPRVSALSSPGLRSRPSRRAAQRSSGSSSRFIRVPPSNSAGTLPFSDTAEGQVCSAADGPGESARSAARPYAPPLQWPPWNSARSTRGQPPTTGSARLPHGASAPGELRAPTPRRGACGSATPAATAGGPPARITPPRPRCSRPAPPAEHHTDPQARYVPAALGRVRRSPGAIRNAFAARARSVPPCGSRPMLASCSGPSAGVSAKGRRRGLPRGRRHRRRPTGGPGDGNPS